jgi:hypothetical protein
VKRRVSWRKAKAQIGAVAPKKKKKKKRADYIKRNVVQLLST